MADGVAVTPGSGVTVATDDTGASGHIQLFKLAYSADGVATMVLADASGLEVQLGAALPAGAATIGNVSLVPLATNGLSIHSRISTATTNAVSVKASAGKLYSVYAHNLNAAVRYLKLYNKASAPTVGTDTPVLRLPIPGDAAGAGFVLNTDMGAAFATGIAFAITTGVADTDTASVAANEIVVNLLFS